MLKKYLSKTGAVWIIAAACCLLWGSAFPAIKIGYRVFNISSDDTATIILFAGVRFLFAGVITIIIFSLANKKMLLPTKKSIPRITVLSMFQTTIQYIFFYLGLAFTTGTRASVIQGTNVFIALLISSLIFKYERLNISKIAGCVVGFAGVLLVSLDIFSDNTSVSFIGEAFILVSTISYAFSSVFMKKYSANDNPAMLSGWQFIIGGAVMSICGYAFGGRLTFSSIKAVLLILYLSILSAIAYSLWSILLKYNPVSRVTVCGFLTPIFGFVLSSLFAGDNAGVGILAVGALALVVVGMLLVNYNKKV